MCVMTVGALTSVALSFNKMADLWMQSVVAAFRKVLLNWPYNDSFSGQNPGKSKTHFLWSAQDSVKVTPTSMSQVEDMKLWALLKCFCVSVLSTEWDVHAAAGGHICSLLCSGHYCYLWAGGDILPLWWVRLNPMTFKTSVKVRSPHIDGIRYVSSR